MYLKILMMPVISGVLTYFLVKHFGLNLSLKEASDISSFGGTIASIATTMLGFLLASLAVLVSIDNTNLIKQMKESGHHKDLVFTIFFGCFLEFVCLLIGFCFFFFSIYWQQIFYILLGFEVATLFSFIGIGHKFWLVLSNLKTS